MNRSSPQKRPSYTKPWLSYQDQLARLTARGLSVSDLTAAQYFLSHVSCYRIQASDFGTILLHLVYIRNLCAHHSRLWDRVWSVKATLPRGKHWEPPLLPGNDRLYSTLLLVDYLLKNCPAVGYFAAEWKDRFITLLKNPLNTPAALLLMGMPAEWNKHPTWSK
jgi:abortive infection bacteriophage resistance protein